MIHPIISWAATVIVAAVLFVALAWQTLHMLDWWATLWTEHSNGSLAAYLRIHADTYMSHLQEYLNRVGEAVE